MEPLLTFNGIDADTGTYAIPPMTLESFLGLVKGSTTPGNLGELQARDRYINEPHYAPVEGVDVKDLAQTGWGVIFPYNHNPAIREALKPLLDLRRAQSTRIHENLYREIAGADGYRSADQESKTDFLERFDAGGGGAVDPNQLPYYLMLVGSPEEIPFTFQYQLDVQYAVGRLYFDNVEDFARYAAAVVEAESGRLALSKRATFFGPANEDDRATALSSAELVIPLAGLMAQDQPGWKIESIVGEAATKARLARLLGGGETPALLFTANHGVCMRPDDPRQFTQMGSLLCQDWPGPETRVRLSPEEHYFGGEDVASDARLLGLIAFHFACFSSGTPAQDDFIKEGVNVPRTLAPRPLVSYLPQRLLRGGTLAAVGHVDRAWGYSFKAENGSSQLRVFKSTLKRLMEGHPVGSALEYFNNRYAELSSDLAVKIRSARYSKPPDPYDLSFRWASNNDARNYTVAGDPAVRLFVAEDPAKESRPSVPAPIVIQSTFLETPQASGAEDFGLMDTIRDAPNQAVETFQQLVGRITDKLGETLDNIRTVEVATYSASDMSGFKVSSGVVSGGTLRAFTRVSLDGNTTNCVPEKDGELDSALWEIHARMVEKALANRVEMIKLLASAAASLTGGLKIL